MKGRSRMVAALLAVWAVAGCASLGLGGRNGEPPAEGVAVLARVDGWRSELTSDPEGTRQVPSLLLEIAADEETAREAWAATVPEGLPARSGTPQQVGIYADLAGIDFSEQVVVVYSSAQSGSCPGWLVDAAYEAGMLQVTETDVIPEGANGCNDSRVEYSLVLAVDRDKLPPAEDLPVDRVRIDDRNTDGLVTAYPALRE